MIIYRMVRNVSMNALAALRSMHVPIPLFFPDSLLISFITPSVGLLHNLIPYCQLKWLDASNEQYLKFNEIFTSLRR